MKRSIDHIRVLQVAPGGAHVDLGVGFAGTTQGGIVVATTDAMNAMAIDFLDAGHAVEKEGKLLDPIGQSLPHKVIGCTELAIVVGVHPNGKLRSTKPHDEARGAVVSSGHDACLG